MNFEQYLTSLDSWMEYWQFEKRDIPDGLDVDRMFYRGRVEGSKFGMVDTYSFVKHIPDNTTSDFAKSYSNNLFEYAFRIRSGAPVGLERCLSFTLYW